MVSFPVGPRLVGGAIKRESVSGDDLAVLGNQSAILEDVAGDRPFRDGFLRARWVRSSPTVVDGRLYVGSSDGYIYALEAGVDGRSEDSRVMSGTLGHHDAWSGKIDGQVAADDSSSEPSPTQSEMQADTPGSQSDDASGHGFGFGAALAGLGTAYYLLRGNDDDTVTEK